MTICRGAFNRVIPASGRGHAWPGAVRRKERTSWPTTTSSRAAVRGIRLGQPPHREPPGAGPRPGGRESGPEPHDSSARRRRHARDPHVNCRFRTVPQASSTTANQVSARRGLGLQRHQLHDLHPGSNARTTTTGGISAKLAGHSTTSCRTARSRRTTAVGCSNTTLKATARGVRSEQHILGKGSAVRWPSSRPYRGCGGPASDFGRASRWRAAAPLDSAQVSGGRGRQPNSRAVG